MRGLATRRAGGGRRRTQGAELAYSGVGVGGGGLCGASKTGATPVMTASRMPVTRIPSRGFGDAAAKEGRDGGLEYWVTASTRTTAFATTSVNLSL